MRPQAYIVYVRMGHEMQIIRMLDVKIVSAAKGFHSCEMRCSICQSLCMISERQGMIAYNPMHEAASQDKY